MKNQCMIIMALLNVLPTAIICMNPNDPLTTIEKAQSIQSIILTATKAATTHSGARALADKKFTDASTEAQNAQSRMSGVTSRVPSSKKPSSSTSDVYAAARRRAVNATK